ncbi:MAG: hypothetical protein ACK41W_16085, partial [Cyanobacteriota bacterium]
ESLGKASMTWRIYSRTANLFSSRPPPWRLFHSSRSAAKYQFFEVPFIYCSNPTLPPESHSLLNSAGFLASPNGLTHCHCGMFRFLLK